MSKHTETGTQRLLAGHRKRGTAITGGASCFAGMASSARRRRRRAKRYANAHAAQQATGFRRDLERRIVLAEAVAQMRRQGRPECEMADLFTDFKGIQVTLAVVSRALIHGRIDCKAAGRLLVHLQTMSKLLWMVQRKGRKENQELPQICADERRLNRELEAPVLPAPQAAATFMIRRTFHDEEPRVAVDGKIRAFPEELRSMPHCKWEEVRAA